MASPAGDRAEASGNSWPCQCIHSHAIHFFMLAPPTSSSRHDAPAQDRNVLGMVKKAHAIARMPFEVRKLGSGSRKRWGESPSILQRG